MDVENLVTSTEASAGIKEISPKVRELFVSRYLCENILYWSNLPVTLYYRLIDWVDLCISQTVACIHMLCCVDFKKKNCYSKIMLLAISQVDVDTVVFAVLGVLIFGLIIAVVVVPIFVYKRRSKGRPVRPASPRSMVWIYFFAISCPCRWGHILSFCVFFCMCVCVCVCMFICVCVCGGGAVCSIYLFLFCLSTYSLWLLDFPNQISPLQAY